MMYSQQQHTLNNVEGYRILIIKEGNDMKWWLFELVDYIDIMY